MKVFTSENRSVEQGQRLRGKFQKIWTEQTLKLSKTLQNKDLSVFRLVW